MRLNRTASLLTIAFVLVVGAPAGCGESEEEKANAQICDARDDMAKQVKELQNLELTTASTDQVKENLNAVKADLSTIADSADVLADDRRQEVAAANDAFTATVKQTAASVGTSVSLEAAADQVSGALQELSASYRDTLGTLDCS